MATSTARNDYSELTIQSDGSFSYYCGERGIKCHANFSLHLISLAWENGCNMEDLADGFGQGLGTMGGDWSGIRDSSDEASRKMLARALQYIADKLER